MREFPDARALAQGSALMIGVNSLDVSQQLGLCMSTCANLSDLFTHMIDEHSDQASSEIMSAFAAAGLLLALSAEALDRAATTLRQSYRPPPKWFADMLAEAANDAQS